jgi:hypothetical protein
LYLGLSFFEEFVGHIQIDFQTILLAFEFADDLFMFVADSGPAFVVFQFEIQPDSFLFAFFEFLLEFVDLFEQFLQAVFVLVVLFYVYFDLFIRRGGRYVHLIQVYLLLADWHTDWHPLFHLPTCFGLYSCRFDFTGGSFLFDFLNDCLSFDNNRLL